MSSSARAARSIRVSRVGQACAATPTLSLTGRERSSPSAHALHHGARSGPQQAGCASSCIVRSVCTRPDYSRHPPLTHSTDHGCELCGFHVKMVCALCRGGLLLTVALLAAALLLPARDTQAKPSKRGKGPCRHHAALPYPSSARRKHAGKTPATTPERN